MESPLWQTLTRDLDRLARAGVAPIDSLTVLGFEGPDARSFLQGYLTCDMDTLDATPTLAALCNLKGRVVANGWCAAIGDDAVGWVVHRSLADVVADFMAKYLAFSRTRLVHDPDARVVLGVLGDDGQPAPRIVDSRESLEQLLEQTIPCDPDTWHRARLAAGVAIITAATSETYLPQMLGLVELGAVDFDKGCHLTSERPAHPGPLQDAAGRDVGEIIDAHDLMSLAVMRAPFPEGPLAQDGLTLTLAS